MSRGQLPKIVFVDLPLVPSCADRMALPPTACFDESGAMFIIFSDLDGTLLDRDSYSFEPAQEALLALERAAIPLILSTSKTRAELEPLRTTLCNSHPFIAENGGVVVIPQNYFPFQPSHAAKQGMDYVLRFGSPYGSIVGALRAASAASGVAVRGFSDMTTEAIADETGLSLEEAARAQVRDHDEPFVVLDTEHSAALLRAITESGKRWTRGGRFYHITDHLDKAAGAQLLMDCYRRVHDPIITVALGDAENDIPLLRCCDRAFIVQSPAAAVLRSQLPDATVTAEPGPRGWNRAVLDLLAGESL